MIEWVQWAVDEVEFHTLAIRNNDIMNETEEHITCSLLVFFYI